MVHHRLTFLQRVLFAGVFSCLLALAAVLFVPTNALAFGITPPTFTLKVARGMNFSTKVSLQKEVVDKDLDIPISVLTSGDTAGVISLQDPRFVIPAGELWHTYQVRGHVSDSVANGNYRVKVVFRQERRQTLTPGEGSNAQAQLVMQLPLILNLEITGEQVVSSTFISAQVPPAEVDDSLLLNAQFENKGNVGWKPDEILVRVYRIEDTQKQTPFEFRVPVKQFIDPGLTYTYNLEFAHTLAQGRYSGEAIEVSGGQEGQRRPIPVFDVLAADTLAKKLVMKYVSTNQNEYYEGDPDLVEVAIENTGSVRTRAVVTAAIYQDGRMIASQASAPQIVEKGEVGIARFKFENLLVGTYQIRAYADYDGKTTTIIDRMFTIIPRPVEAAPVFAKAPEVLNVARVWLTGSACMCFPYWLLLLILFILLILMYLVYRKYRQLKHERDEARMDCRWTKEQGRMEAQAQAPMVVHPPASNPVVAVPPIVEAKKPQEANSMFSNVERMQPSMLGTRPTVVEPEIKPETKIESQPPVLPPLMPPIPPQTPPQNPPQIPPSSTGSL